MLGVCWGHARPVLEHVGAMPSHASGLLKACDCRQFQRRGQCSADAGAVPGNASDLFENV